ncbi:MAG TPA: hypothetical protein VE960_06960, partial [bacterium]|nr:hypothetical protein [bacterium]
MRHRRWVVVLAILIIAVLPLSFLGLKVASRHPAVKRAVLGRIMPEIAGELTIGGLEMGLASLHFTDIMLQFENGGYVVVPYAAVNVSLPRLVSGGLIPRSSLSSIIISDPRVLIAYGAEDADDAPAETFDVTTLESYLPDYLGISGARVAFRDERTMKTVSVDSIDLLLEREGDGPVTGGASGNCMGGTRNFEADFTWDGSVKTLAVDGMLTDARLDGTLPVPPSVPLEFLSGTTSAAFVASVSPDTIRGLELGFTVSDAVVSITSLGETVTGVDASGSLTGGVATLSSASGTWRSSSWSVSGSVSDDGVMENVLLAAADVPLAAVAGHLELDEYGISGNLDVSARVDGPFDDPVAVVDISSGEVGVGDIQLTNVSGTTKLTRERVLAEGVEAVVCGGDVSVEGALERGETDSDWSFEFSAGASGLDLGQLTEITTGDTTASGTISLTDVVGSGTLRRPDLESLVSWEDVLLGPAVLGSGAGRFTLSDGRLSASLAASDSTYSLACLVEEAFDDPTVSGEVVLAGVRMETLLPSLVPPLPPLMLTGAVDIGGPSDALAVEGSVVLEGDVVRATVEVAGGMTAPGSSGSPVLTLDVSSQDAQIRDFAAPLEARLSMDASELS